MSDEVTARFLQDLKSKHADIRNAAAMDLRRYVHHASLDLSADSFIRYMNELNRRIFDLINSSELIDKLGGITLIDQLIDVPYEENETKIIRFAHYLRMVFQQTYSSSGSTTGLGGTSTSSQQQPHLHGLSQGGHGSERSEKDALEYRLLQAASTALGHLARVGGTIAADIVEFQVKQSLEWLEGDRSEQRRYAAVLVLKELAENTPTLFNVHVGTFLDHIWTPIRDQKLFIREAAIAALRCCLNLISKRALRLRSQRYGQIYGEVLNSFKISPAAIAPSGSPGTSPTLIASTGPPPSIECIHGGLLIINELLRNTGEFMISRFSTVVELVLRYKDFAVRGEKPIDSSLHHSSPAFQAIYAGHSRIIRDSVIMLLPKLAAFQTDQFVRGGHLDTVLAHIITNLRIALNVGTAPMNSPSASGVAIHPVSREIAFLALGEVAIIVRERILVELDSIVGLIREGLTTSSAQGALSKPSKKVFCPEALTCLASISCAIGIRLLPWLTNDLVESMFLGGLSSTLVESLSIMIRFLPLAPIGTANSTQTRTPQALLAIVQEKLLLCLSSILHAAAMNPTSAALTPSPGAYGTSSSSSPQSTSSGLEQRTKERRGSSLTLAGFLAGPGRTFAHSVFLAPTPSSTSSSALGGAAEVLSPFDLLLLALATLGNFPFTTHSLLPLIRDLRLLDILDYSHPKLRRMAATTTANILAKTQGGGEMISVTMTNSGSLTLTRIPPSPATIASAQTLLPIPLAITSSPVSRPSVASSQPPSLHSTDAPPPPHSAASLGHPCYTPAQVAIIDECLERLLSCALTDPCIEIRRAIVDALNLGSGEEVEDDEDGEVDDAIMADEFEFTPTDHSNEDDLTTKTKYRMDEFLLNNPAFIHQLFMILNDEHFGVRRSALSILGRVALRSPSFIMPSLRKTLIQLLSEVQHGGDVRHREESSMLLGHLISSAKSLMIPYVETILKVLIPKLRGLSSSSTSGVGSTAGTIPEQDHMVSSCILEALGKLSVIGGNILSQAQLQAQMASNSSNGQQLQLTSSASCYGHSQSFSSNPQVVRNYLNELFPILLNILSDKTSRIRKEVALRTLNQLIIATGYVVEPYFKYPTLLSILLGLLKSASHAPNSSSGVGATGNGANPPPSTASKLNNMSSALTISNGSATLSRQSHNQSFLIRSEVMKIFGVLGALDPFLYKGILEGLEINNLQTAKTSGVTSNDKDGAATPAPGDASNALPSLSTSLSQLSDDYYPTVALQALLRILRDPSLSQHHNKVVQAVMFVVKSLGSSGVGSKSAKYLPIIVPTFLWVIKNPHPSGSNSGTSGSGGNANSAGATNTPVTGAVGEHDFSLRDTLFIQLGNLISIVRVHIKPYLEGIFELIQHTWGSGGAAATGVNAALQVQVDGQLSTSIQAANTTSSATSQPQSQQSAEIWTTHILILIEKIVLALRDDFKVYLPNLLPHMLHLLHTDRSFEKHITLKILHTFNVINQQYYSGSSKSQQAGGGGTGAGSHSNSQSTNLSTDYLYLIIPSFIRLAEHPDSNLIVKQSAIASLASIARILNLHEYASRILLPLARMLEIPDMQPSKKETSLISLSGAASATAALITQTLSNLTSTISGALGTPHKKPSELLTSALHPHTLTPLREDILQLLCILVFQFQSNFLHYVPLFHKIFQQPGWTDKNLGGLNGNKEAVSSVLKSATHLDAITTAYSAHAIGYFPAPPTIQASYLERYDYLIAKLLHFQRVYPQDLDGIKLGLKNFTGFGMTGLAGNVMSVALSFGINVHAMGGPSVVAGLNQVSGNGNPNSNLNQTISSAIPPSALSTGTPTSSDGTDSTNFTSTEDLDSDFVGVGTGGGTSGGSGGNMIVKKLKVSQPNLKKAWEVSQRSTRDDWIEWMRGFSIELLKESPSAALRACSILAQKYPTLARELFHAAFVSCWSELSDQYQDDLIRCLESCFHAPNLPSELLQILLNLAEFMERDGKTLPIDIRTLCSLAESVHAYAKALHYAEKDFKQNSAGGGSTESLISINNQLGNPEAATGVLIYTKKQDGSAELKTTWYEKLNRWEEALEAYERTQLSQPDAIEPTVGRMRCLKALGEWERLHTLSEITWNKLSFGTNNINGLKTLSPLSAEDESIRREIAPLGCTAAWNLGRWSSMAQYLPGLDEGRVESEFLRVVIALHSDDIYSAYRYIERTRELLDTELVSLMGESYQRAYRVLVQVQQLGELEEIIRYKLLDTSSNNQPKSLSSNAINLSTNSTPHLIREMWSKRLLSGVARNVEVWQSILTVRSIVINPRDDMDTWLKFSSLCRKNNRLALSLKVLTTLLGFNPQHMAETTPIPVDFPNVTYTYLKHLWTASGDGGLRMKSEALRRMEALMADLNAYSENPQMFQLSSAAPAQSSPAPSPIHQTPNKNIAHLTASALGFGPITGASKFSSPSSVSSTFDPLSSPFHLANLTPAQLHRLKSRIYLKMGLWQLALTTFTDTTDTKSIPTVPAVSFENSRSVTNSPAAVSNPTTSSAALNDETIPRILLNFQRATEEIGYSLDGQHGLPTNMTPVCGAGREPSNSISDASSSRGPSPFPTPNLPTRSLVHSPPPKLILLQDHSNSSGAAGSNSSSSTVTNRRLYKVWHNWAVMNFRIVQHYKQKKQELMDLYKALHSSTSYDSVTQAQLARLDQQILDHVLPAIRGFFRSIALAGDAQSLQDILRLLTLWFTHGMHPTVESVLASGFNDNEGGLCIDTWLSVIPQIIARIDSTHTPIRRLIFTLLCKIGLKHAQALVYPLAVVSKSTSRVRKQAALEVMNFIRSHSAVLVEQSLMVSRELIRVAILWHEMWHESLEEASRLWFGQRNFSGMLATLQPLRRMMERGATTLREISFVQAFGRDFQEAFEWMDKYISSHNDSDLNQAWDILVSCFRRINKQLTLLSDLELQYVSPTLLEAHSLELAMPGTYLADRDCLDKSSVLISYFNPTMKVIESKQRPRKLSIMGNDGQEYAFLLKGHEDLRQDKRVMQLFGLVNTLLVNDAETGKKDLKIRGYSVIPLAPNSGLIQWLHHCDTLHSLIKDYRDARKILLNIEHRLMLQMAPDHPLLTLMQKVEVFEYALARTTGQDLAKVLWLNSQSSEMWLDRRTNYTRSLAVMCMVGYILGLGDRHPCNIMLQRSTGKILHIDFGDCFEVAMQRDKFPEKIPFRLTRMLVNAMEVSGIEGTFRMTADSVMRVLRDNKESVMAVLEAFVYDPLINWRLLATKKQNMHGADEVTNATQAAAQAAGNAATDQVPTQVSTVDPATGVVNPVPVAPVGATDNGVNPITSNPIGAELGPDAPTTDGDSEVLNAKAVAVISRVESKLQGRDFDPKVVLDTSEQVEKLIRQATSHTNLCQCYIGWCPFW